MTTVTISTETWQGRLGMGLAPRELEATLHAASDLTAKEIAKLMGIAPGTVSKRLDDARFKLGAKTIRGLVLEAYKRQIISPCALESSPSWRQHNPSSMKTRPCGRAVAAKGRSKLV